MKLAEIIRIVEGTLVTKGADLSKDVTLACGADLMSDVLAYCKPRALLLTGLTHPQVVRTAEMADIAAIVFVRGKKPPQETISLAEEKNIPLITSPYTMFELCGRLYMNNLASCD
jgi:predicted transcriptional regulator